MGQGRMETHRQLCLHFLVTALQCILHGSKMSRYHGLAGEKLLEIKCCIAQVAGSIRGSQRQVVDCETSAKETVVLDTIDVVMYHWNRWEITPAKAVSAVQTLFCYLSPTLDQDAVPSFCRCTIPPQQLAPAILWLQSPSWMASLAASAVPPETTVVEAAGVGGD